MGFTGSGVTGVDGPKAVASGLGLVESPRWHDGRLYFADWNAGEILATDGASAPEGVVRIGSLPLSFDFLADGSMVVVKAREGQLLRRNAKGDLAPFARLPAVGGMPWNEIVADGKGNCYVNGPDLVLVDESGHVTAFGEAFAFANGMAISPDGTTLVVAESHGHRLTTFDIASDGTPSGRRIWADLGDGTPDGICFDAQGCIWYADVPNQCCARVREGGEELQRIEIDRGAFACMLGGPDRRTLFVTAAVWKGMEGIPEMPGTGQLLSVEVDCAGAGRP